MTRDELVAVLFDLSNEAAPVDTDAAALVAVVARMLRAGDPLDGLSEAAHDVELRALERRARADRPRAGGAARE